MAFAPNSVSFDLGDGSIVGCFNETTYGKFFEFSKNNERVLAPPPHGGRNIDYPHLIWVGDGTSRSALVMRTVAYVIVNERDDGSALIEKWLIKNRRDYIGN